MVEIPWHTEIILIICSIFVFKVDYLTGKETQSVIKSRSKVQKKLSFQQNEKTNTNFVQYTFDIYTHFLIKFTGVSLVNKII